MTDSQTLNYTTSATAELVTVASGRAPDLDDAEMVSRLQKARRLRVRMEAREESKWNLALSGVAEDVERAEDEEDRAELAQEHAELLSAAGFGERALEVLARISPSLDEISLDDIPVLRLLLEQAKVLASLGRVRSIQGLRDLVARLQPKDARETSIQSQVVELLEQTRAEVPAERVDSMKQLLRV